LVDAAELSAAPTWKTKSALESPSASRVMVPVLVMAAAVE
jgi:hypothetical protein